MKSGMSEREDRLMGAWLWAIDVLQPAGKNTCSDGGDVMGGWGIEDTPHRGILNKGKEELIYRTPDPS
jgi:hypothetical protein